jgi:WD40 repeat protein
LDNRDIKVYNLSGDRIARLPRTSRIGHRRLVTSLACYGSLLLSASFDKTVNCWSLDYNPPKSLASSSNSNKLTTNQNKENSINLAAGENTLVQSEQHLLSPTPSQLNASSSQLQVNQQTPLNLITNNSAVNLKSINTLSKLAERIKI